MALVLTAHCQPHSLQGQETGPVHTRNKTSMKLHLEPRGFPYPTARKDPNASVGMEGAAVGAAEGIKEPPAASMVETSSRVGKVCASHRTRWFLPSGLLQPQACSTPSSPSTLTPPRTPLTFHLLLQPCTRHVLPSPPTLISTTNREDDRTIVTLHPGERAVRCGEGIQLCWFNTVALSIAQSSLKQKVRTNEAKGHPGYLFLKPRSWSSVPLKVPISEPPPG